MKVTVYTHKPFVKTTFDEVVSIIENADNIGIGRVGKHPLYYPKSVVKKVKVILK